MTLSRKPFAEFAAELVAGLAAGRGDEPIAESARFKVIEVAPPFRGRFRGRLVAKSSLLMRLWNFASHARSACATGLSLKNPILADNG